MPYIKEDLRQSICFGIIDSPGELNYVFTLACKSYLNRHDLSYQSINDIVGALECCKQEFYRRVVIPYEDKKCKLNGDVYG